MNAALKLLADASLEVAAAEEALDAGAYHTAGEQLDRAGASLADLRTAWPSMGRAERGFVGPAARAVRDRLDAAGRRLPRLTALSVATAVVDPEQEEAPPE